jgi:uncharacterized protein (TIGR00297 family)
MSPNFIIGFILSFIVAGLAYRKKSLTLSGMISAILLGTIVYGYGHWIFYMFMMFFFMSSLVIRKIVTILYPSAHKTLTTHQRKHEARTWVQVLANGGLLGLISFYYSIAPSNLVVFVAALSMAASTSDTWASEIGILSNQKPKSLIRRQEMETGLSGGVTQLGLLASLGGSALISLVFGIFLLFTKGFNPEYLLATLLCLIGGFSGSLVDSILGEFFQAKYKTIKSEIIEVSGSSTDALIHGLRWVDNNLVNFLSNLAVVGSFSFVMLWTQWL